ncbi:hypothetical protein QL285_045776 [Trifolium repens]|nr:hypothetical protein QL285_045776 [Trifolium repens]
MALKIHTFSDNDEIPKPKENPASEKETLVEKGQNINVAEDKVSGPKEGPLPQSKPLVEDQNATNEGNQDNVQKDSTILMQDAPNSEQKNDSLTNPEVEDKEDESKEKTPQENKQPSPEEMLSKDKADETKSSKDDGTNKADDGKVDLGNSTEGPNEGEGPKVSTDGDGIKVLPTNSSINYTLPSTSTKSGQASLTQESLHDSDGIPEAEAGGPDLASVSSTSRLFASLGVQEEEFANMHKTDPVGTLRLLLSKRQSQTNISNYLLLRLTTDFVQKDILKQLEEEPTRAYSHLAFLKKLHNPLTDETTLGKVIQLSLIIDQFAKVVQKRNENDTRLATQQQAQAMFYEKTQKAQAEVDRLSSQASEGNPGVENCNKNIAFYKQQIEQLENQIVGYMRKIIEEEVERARIEQEAKASTQELIDAQGREGIQVFSSAEVVVEEIKFLESSNLVVEKELATLKRIYSECTRDL